MAVVFNSEVAMNVLGVGAVASQRCKDDPMFQSHVADFDRLEELAGESHGKLCAREKAAVQMIFVRVLFFFAHC